MIPNKVFYRLLSRLNIGVVFCCLLSGDVKAEDGFIFLNDSCDTITKKEFLSLSKVIYKKIDIKGSLSQLEKKEAIKIYNSIFLLSSSVLKSKKILRKYQQKFDLNFKLIFGLNTNIIISKKSGIFFEVLGVTLLNNFLINTGEYICKDIFLIK